VLPRKLTFQQLHQFYIDIRRSKQNCCIRVFR
jgi:hypothetical protein